MLVRNWIIFNGYEVIKEAFVERGGDFMGRELPSVWKYVEFDDGENLHQLFFDQNIPILNTYVVDSIFDT